MSTGGDTASGNLDHVLCRVDRVNQSHNQLYSTVFSGIKILICLMLEREEVKTCYGMFGGAVQCLPSALRRSRRSIIREEQKKSYGGGKELRSYLEYFDMSKH